MPEHSPAPTPHRAIYGFAFYMLFTILFIVYVAWAYLPVELGLHSYLPDKYFAVFIPVLALVGAWFFIVFIYPAINLSLTPNIDAISSVVDPKVALPKGTEFTDWAQLQCKQQNISPTRNATVPLKYCDLCRTTHTPNQRAPIAPLRFMDLQEVNSAYYN
ncbi:phosphatidylinositol N-acetylglucosaminyltransferase subunit P [Scaptodrosophila lebanonensis]|uniref:Phosphatidylinositol N-acetylglucosaminyltransferase subunit P n=1 Tax=Drosophila lebanonensis TaxID=7225 RepID=A0A6J2TLQ0_DROLE|nr:phosphatidylinositol N-acetylglucosaminyltransferase subunit P [Scaptodrosophila lebanonensis]